MHFADIHIHALFGADDGARNEQVMRDMIDASYADGVRLMCMTPHFHPGYFGENTAAVAEAYGRAETYVREKYPELMIYLGNELRYDVGCLSWLRDNKCAMMGKNGHILVDFSENEAESRIESGLYELQNAGYTPILAHAERYRNLAIKKTLFDLRENGVLIQMDTQAILGDFGFTERRRAGAILDRRLADFVGSDAHDLIKRKPGLSAAYERVEKKYGKEYAYALFWGNARRLFGER